MNEKIIIASLISGLIMGFFVMALIDQQINGYNYQDRILFHYWAMQNTEQTDLFMFDEFNETYDNIEVGNYTK